ncbi:inactive serine/threonine-protein kinase TEX14 [Sceloporus undulatus]|uniref:inactive serine/threonine-protein kinase TEX14 n=1 Tax=Sceloporus undulatus TaxID=8520 RepID=UPI001C4BB08D|nr:inactive serine/threonine-protein kinase TEX14 [Sceloporus undulatus]
MNLTFHLYQRREDHGLCSPPSHARAAWQGEKESLEARLHEYVKQGNYEKVKKLLKKGTSANTVNSLGQTPLFTAALLGLGKLVDILLDYGSDPNHRCYDGSTPVHAAAFSGDQSILSKLLDAGGDLRVHDKNGKNPQSWAVTAGKDVSAQMLEFIQRCTAHMQAALHSNSFELLRKVDSPKGLVCSLSKFGSITQGTADSPLRRLLRRGNSVPPNLYSFGFGKFYLTGGKLGYLASLPIIGDKEVVQADDEPTFTFPTGPYMMMTNLMWRGNQVTVKELSIKPHQHCSRLRLADLLLAEQERSSKLRHPHLLLLLAVCLSSDLEKTRLVFERVNFGSLYSILHERRLEFPVVRIETIVHILLQVNDALRFLHFCGFIHRTLNSYAVVIVLPGEAKLTNLEYMIESKDGGEHSDLTRVPIPPQLYKWCAPEVILERSATTHSDVYSFCVVMQEALTETIPWDGLEGSDIKDLIVSGQWLEADARLPKPYYDIVKTGLEFKPKQRTMNLQDIRYILKTDLKELIESCRNPPGENCGPPKNETRSDINICLPSASAVLAKMPEVQEGPTQIARTFSASRCIASHEDEGDMVHDPEPVIRMAQSSPVLNVSPTTLGDASDTNESLRSFEINEIYTCYSDVCEESVEDEEEMEWVPRTQRESHTFPRYGPKVQSPEPTKTQNHQKSCSEESNTSYTRTESQREELNDSSECSQSPPGQSCPNIGCGNNRGKVSQSSFDQKVAKCVLTLTVCKTKLREATESLCRTEKNLDEIEARSELCQSLPGTQRVQLPGLSASLKAYSEKVDTILKSIKVPFSGDQALLWKAVGPPRKNYIPPPLCLPGTYQPLTIPSFQVLEKEHNSDNRSQDTTCWDKFRLEAPKWPGDRGGLEPDYQVLPPGVSVRRRKNANQSRCRNAFVDGINASEEISSKSVPEMYEASLRREERRMAQPAWTTEVKQMAKKAVSGNLDPPPQYLCSGWTLESEAESTRDAFESATSREQIGCCPPNCEAGRQQSGNGIGVHNLVFYCDGERDPEKELKRFGGPQNQSKSSQFPTNEDLITCGVTSRKNAALSVTFEDLCKRQLEEAAYSPSSSLDLFEEFLTPDSDFFFDSLAFHEHLKLESSTVEDEDLEITQIMCRQDDLEVSQEICGKKQHPIAAGQGGKWSPCSAEPEHLHKEAPGGDLFTASTGTTQGARPGEAPGEFKEKDVLVTDIQDLSSIPYEDTCKPAGCKTPGNTHSPTCASTPLHPAPATSRVSSPVTECKDHCVMTIDLTWASQEGSLSGLGTFTASYEKGKTVELTSAGFPEPGVSSESSCPSLVRTGTKESEKKRLSTLQSHCQKGVPEQADSKEQELEEITLNKWQADCSPWINETSCLEETERAHSSLDNILSALYEPTADSRSLREKPLDPAKRKPSRANLRNIEMKGSMEDSFSESDGSTENAEGLF